MTLCCRAFFNEFLTEFEIEKNNRARINNIYQKYRNWTIMMLGTSKSRDRGNYGLLGRVGKKFGYIIEPEWRHIDQVWFYRLPKPKGWRKGPWKNDVLVEHENNIRRMEYTIFKFEEISAPLKVGIFYPGDNEEEYLEMCQKMILKQVSSYPGSVYLIIFGFQDEKNEIYWHGYEIDFKGNIVQLHDA